MPSAVGHWMGSLKGLSCWIVRQDFASAFHQAPSTIFRALFEPETEGWEQWSAPWSCRWQLACASSELQNMILFWESVCGTVDRVVASDTRGPGFAYSQWQLFFNI